ncbi:regulator [Streptomyces sp. NPDC018352]|uniref:regulator n=1 Tax=Streptomyces sp. NPDC018352 TaxID=3157194 RepID=UPI00340CEA37
MTTLSGPAEVRKAVELLASRSLIRLVTEIDDNGPIPPRGLARTLPDLAPHQIRHSSEQARTIGLVRTRPGAGLVLTEPGRELADLYDAAARWSRTHNYPHATCGFITRVQDVLQLLTPVQDPVAAPSVVPTEAAGDLAHLRAALDRWIGSHWSGDEQAGALQCLPETV